MQCIIVFMYNNVFEILRDNKIDMVPLSIIK